MKISISFKYPFRADQYEQNSADSIVTEAGLYDFEHFSAAEIDTINQVLATAKRKYPRHYRGIGLAVESYGVIYKPRYILHEIIIIKYGNSEKQLDQLAVGLAYKTKGAYFRKPALEYMQKSVENIKKSEWDRIPNIPKWTVYNDMSDICEALYQFEDALKYAARAINEKGIFYPYAITHPGEIYRKIDINLCVKYYEDLIQSGGAGEYAAIAEEELKKARELQAHDYKYRPHPKKKPDYFDVIEEKIHQAALKFI